MFVPVRHMDSKEGRAKEGEGDREEREEGKREGGAESTRSFGNSPPAFWGGGGGAVGFSSRSSRAMPES